MGSGRRTHIHEIWRSAVGRKTIEHAVAVGVAVKVVVEPKDVELDKGRPGRHDFELPFAVGGVGHARLDAVVEAPGVEGPAGEELGDAALEFVVAVGVDYLCGGVGEGGPV